MKSVRRYWLRAVIAAAVTSLLVVVFTGRNDPLSWVSPYTTMFFHLGRLSAKIGNGRLCVWAFALHQKCYAQDLKRAQANGQVVKLIFSRPERYEWEELSTAVRDYTRTAPVKWMIIDGNTAPKVEILVLREDAFRIRAFLDDVKSQPLVNPYE